MSQTGSVVLTETVRSRSRPREFSTAFRPGQAAGPHVPGKVMTDLALALAIGGDRPTHITVPRVEPGVVWFVESDRLADDHRACR